jgi:hypothetical protein
VIVRVAQDFSLSTSQCGATYALVLQVARRRLEENEFAISDSGSASGSGSCAGTLHVEQKHWRSHSQGVLSLCDLHENGATNE